MKIENFDDCVTQGNLFTNFCSYYSDQFLWQLLEKENLKAPRLHVISHFLIKVTVAVPRFNSNFSTRPFAQLIV
ncbi:hypothetical protein T4D_5552 [Trichinella pseudospiralis]|uniref:Uncharacterized protein n=1 Tax=Trichinella pseudospiralis TaxID=6337 RepID=A0A0V1FV75_TRIPS|nr:hypothetical protein T4D_5552 [Trichinella pseudospiralis]